jgi:RNA polymerase sporulation-specific sigma factor
LDRRAKSIDNALQRVKRKLEKCLNKRMFWYWQSIIMVLK